jgi:pimeloyl-ACP methyl ester carboxylesterase
VGVALLLLGIPGCRPRERPTSSFFDARGVRIHYLVEGSGEPVVLVHGLYSSARINWEWPGTMAALARGHQVVALDLPGHGRSDKPEEASAYGAQMAEDVVLLLDHLDIRRAHVVGYSLGGIVALKVIATHPDRVLSGLLGGMGWLREGGVLQAVWENIPQGGRGGPPPACLRAVADLALSEADVRRIKTPVEILVGDRDPVKPLYVTPLEAVRRDWKVIPIGGAGHLDCIVQPQFIREVVLWVDANTGKVPGAAPGG